MKEIYEFRINPDYENLVPKDWKCKTWSELDFIVKTVTLLKNDPQFEKFSLLVHEIKIKYGEPLFLGWEIKRVYTRKEIDSAKIFYVDVKAVFEPSGEECETKYDENVACAICGAHRKQLGHLRLKKSSIPKKDISKSIAGEVVASKHLKELYEVHNLKGIKFEPIKFKKDSDGFYQPKIFTPKLEISKATLVGCNPFDFSEVSKGRVGGKIGSDSFVSKDEVYKCPNGDNIGLNRLSEAYVLNTKAINEFDFFESRQTTGVKRGLLRPEPLYFCSQNFRKMVVRKGLKGFGFEVAHISDY